MGIRIDDVLTLVKENDGFVVKNKTIYIENDIIAGLDTVPEGFVADTVISGKDKLAIPGLINCHTHSYMTLFRNCADDLSFMDWLFNNILPLEDKMQDIDAYYGASLAMIEMIKSGTTCFADMHMNINETSRAAAEIGMRGVISRGLTGGNGDDGGERRLKQAREEMERWKAEPLLTFMLAPHAPYTCDAAYLKQVKEESERLGVGLNIHLSESLDEYQKIKKQTGRTPVEYIYSLGLFERPTLAAHCVQLTGNDMEIMKKMNVSVVTNPASNMKLGNGFAPVPELNEKGINVCIGTDGAASNNSLNLFQETRLITLIHKGYRKDSKVLGAQDALRFATENGARALGLKGKTGSIQTGYKADIALLDMNVPQFRPANNPVSALAYSANGSEVDTVIIDGKIVMKNREMLTVDEEKIYFETTAIARRYGICK